MAAPIVKLNKQITQVSKRAQKHRGMSQTVTVLDDSIDAYGRGRHSSKSKERINMHNYISATVGPDYLISVSKLPVRRGKHKLSITMIYTG